MVKIRIADSLKLGAWVTATILLVNWILSLFSLEVVELYSLVGVTGVSQSIGASITSLISGIGFAGVNFQMLMYTYLSAVAIVFVGTYAYDWLEFPKTSKEWTKLTAILAYGTIVFYLAIVGLQIGEPQMWLLMVIYYAVVALTLGLAQKNIRKYINL